MSNLLDRAEALHLQAHMPWRQAERLALSELGIDDAAITELVGECTTLGTESLLTGDEISDFARAVLVHGSGLMVALPPCDQAAMRQLLRLAEKVRAWLGDGCSADDVPRAALAALTEFAGSTADRLLSESPKPDATRLSIRIKRELFSFHSQQHWVNKAQSWYENCGVRQGHYITVDANGHVMHMGKCFMEATKAGAYPVTVYELQTNWTE